jgi:hypothetical protein
LKLEEIFVLREGEFDADAVSRNTPLVLKGITITINGGHKVGVLEERAVENQHLHWHYLGLWKQQMAAF